MSPFALVDMTKNESAIEFRLVGKILVGPAALLPESVNIPTKRGSAVLAISPDRFSQSRNGVCPITLVLPLRKPDRARGAFKEPGIIRPKNVQIDFGLDSGKIRYIPFYCLN